MKVQNEKKPPMHHFYVDEAVEYGIHEAIILYNIRFWLEKNRASRSNMHDGFYWTYNTVLTYSRLFPYIPKSSISRYLNNLCELGVLKKANYNKSKLDGTLWYTIPKEYAIEEGEVESIYGDHQ